MEEVKEDKQEMHQAPLLINKDQQLVKPQLQPSHETEEILVEEEIEEETHSEDDMGMS